jgi:hypothetical protein
MWELIEVKRSISMLPADCFLDALWQQYGLWSSNDRRDDVNFAEACVF